MARCSKKIEPPYNVLSKVIRQFIQGIPARGYEVKAEGLTLTDGESAIGKGKECQNSS